MNECFYDNAGVLVDKSHEYAGCGGTPDYYDSETDTWDHIFNDPGGIWQAGWDAFMESQRHASDEYKKEDPAKEDAACKAHCDTLPWYEAGFCYVGCSGAMAP